MNSEFTNCVLKSNLLYLYFLIKYTNDIRFIFSKPLYRLQPDH